MPIARKCFHSRPTVACALDDVVEDFISPYVAYCLLQNCHTDFRGPLPAKSDVTDGQNRNRAADSVHVTSSCSQSQPSDRLQPVNCRDVPVSSGTSTPDGSARRRHNHVRTLSVLSSLLYVALGIAKRNVLWPRPSVCLSVCLSLAAFLHYCTYPAWE